MIRSASVIAALAAWTTVAAKPAPPPPVISTIPVPPFAEETYQSWTVGRVAGLYAAYTANASGSLMGLLCSATGCSVYFNPQHACEADVSIPMLINSSAGSISMAAKCVVLGKGADAKYVLVADEGLSADTLTSAQIGIAIPLASGEFAVSRFGTLGARTAVARAMQLAGARPGKGRAALGDSTY